jgi:hypothetical protein
MDPVYEFVDHDKVLVHVGHHNTGGHREHFGRRRRPMWCSSWVDNGGGAVDLAW